MYKTEKRLREELQLAEGEGCIIFNIGYQLPLRANPADLKISFCLGMEDVQECAHLPLMKGHETALKSYGDKLSTIGYPYKIKLNEKNIAILTVHFDTMDDGKQHRLSVSVGINGILSKEEPIGNVTLLLNNSCFTVFSIKKIDNDNITVRKMSTYQDEEHKPEPYEELILPMDIIEYGDDGAHVIYSEVLDFFPSSYEDYIDILHPEEAKESVE